MKRQRNSASTNKRLQEITKKYMVKFKVDSVDPDAVARWAMESGEWYDAPQDPVKRLRRLISRVLGAEYTIDPQGREVRAMIPVPITSENGQLVWAWSQIYKAPKNHFVLSQQVRRNGILAGCRQHKRDHDSYNDNNVHGVAVDPADYDFNKDLEEDSYPTEYPDEDPDQ